MSSHRTPLLPAVFAGAAAAAAIVTWLYWDDPIGSKVKITQKLHRLPDGGFPVFGDLVGAAKNVNQIHDLVAEMFEHTNNESFVMKLPFFEPIIFVNDPKIVEYILKTKFSVFEKGSIFRTRAQDVLGHGIFNSDGDQWKSQRKLAANIFNVKNFKDFVNEVFSSEMDVFSTVLAGHAADGDVFDLQDLFFRFTFDSFTKIGFGINLGAMNAKESIPFMSAFDAAQTHVFMRMLTPLWELQERFLGTGAAQAAHVQTIRDFGHRIINEKRNMRREQENDLLALLMRVPGDDGKEPSDDRLVDYVLNFLIAGRDTTAQALSWTFFLLHKNPTALAALESEIAAVLQGNSPSYDQIKNDMPYANAVFHEALRLYPSVPLELKQANKTETLPCGTIVPQGAAVAWSPYAMGRTSAIWGDDAKEFKPERWLEMTKQPSPFDYPVFNAGPRVCLGKSMAELEGVYVLVEVARQFKIKVVNEKDVTYANSLTLPMRNGLKVKCTAI
ncbi:cytochrome P450 [Chytriomyces cf. hyalinus JEL632]|nr:cytochrome P450 [Chytriomyces cf. hyalinus JEL632]